MSSSKRMISYAVFSEKEFLNLSKGAVVLYVYLNLLADNSGIVSTTMVMRGIRAAENELEELIKTGYVIKAYDDRCIITHWFVHNNKVKNESRLTEYPKDLELFELDEISKTYKKLPEISRNFHLKENKRKEDKTKEIQKEEKENKEKCEKEVRNHPLYKDIKNYCAEKNYLAYGETLDMLVGYIEDIAKDNDSTDYDFRSDIDNYFKLRTTCEYSHAKAPAISPRAPVPVTTSAPPKF